MSFSERVQPGIAAADTPAAFCIEWHASGTAAELLALLEGLQPGPVVVGLGDSLLRTLGMRVEGFHEFAGMPGMPATPHALWTLVPGATPGEAFERADAIGDALRPGFIAAESTGLFRYRNGRDLSGYLDGAANPVGAAAGSAALIAEGRWRDGSCALVQRYRHHRRPLAALPAADRDAVIGRTFDDDVEIDTAPASAHVKRSAQETFSPPAFVLRRSMPWGDPVRHGLQYIAFMADVGRAERILARMTGIEDGTTDALLRYTQAETGAFYFCPPLENGRLALTPPMA